MYYVYLLRALPNPKQTYIGYTSNLTERLATHNPGESPHSSKNKPWKIVFYSVFVEKETAKDFELYLKW